MLISRLGKFVEFSEPVFNYAVDGVLWKVALLVPFPTWSKGENFHSLVYGGDGVKVEFAFPDGCNNVVWQDKRLHILFWNYYALMPGESHFFTN